MKNSREKIFGLKRLIQYAPQTFCHVPTAAVATSFLLIGFKMSLFAQVPSGDLTFLFQSSDGILWSPKDVEFKNFQLPMNYIKLKFYTCKCFFPSKIFLLLMYNHQLIVQKYNRKILQILFLEC